MTSYKFIMDEQASIESYAGKTFAEADPQLVLARSICTDRCAAKALVYLSAPSAGISYTIAETSSRSTKPIPRTLIWRSLNPSGRTRKSSSRCSTQ